jgi:hypothetical protein
MTQISISQLFTDVEIKAAVKLYAECSPGTFNKRVVEQIVRPAMDRINKATGQENDERYIGYMLEFAINDSKVV